VKLFLVRHGDADAEIPEGLADDARALTAKARQQIQAHFEGLAERMQGITLVLTSPLVRAVQTAQILTFALRHDGVLKAHRSLLPDMPVGAIDSVLSEHEGERLVLVGHAPSMGAMAARLLSLQTFPKPVSPGTVIGLERPDSGGAADLLFFATPGQTAVDTL
jgi:phosphohistidine phosphatase